MYYTNDLSSARNWDRRYDATLYAVWTLVPSVIFTVTFDEDNGSELQTQKVQESGTATRPENDPAKEGYIFVDWFFENAETPWDFATAITKDITLTAKWEAAKFTVTFYSDGVIVE